MTIQVDEHSSPPAVSAAAAWASGGALYGHATRPADVDYGPVAVFDVIVEPLAGRLELCGELDLGGGQRFRDASRAIVTSGASEVVVDLARLRFIDASGLGLLVELHNELAVRETTLRIVNPDARIGRVFSLCGLDAMLPVPVAP